MKLRSSTFALATLIALFISDLVACSDDASPGNDPADAGAISLGDAGYVDAPEPDATKTLVDGGFEGPGGVVVRADRFVTKVVSFDAGDCAGFGASQMPSVVLGPPVGAGELSGGTDVVSLGKNGEIVLSFEPNGIVDGPGADFIVFENAFFAAGDPEKPTAELADVSVSDDGTTWKTFPCTPSTSAPYGTCAGWHPVKSAPGNGVSPVDPAVAGGDAYDLQSLGVTTARYVRVRDLGTVACPVGPTKPTNVGFDLDAI